jgi:transposase
MNKSKTYSPEVRERAVRMVFEHAPEYPSQWACIQSIAEKIGCSGETLRSWVRRTERDQGKRAADRSVHLLPAQSPGSRSVQPIPA